MTRRSLGKAAATAAIGCLAMRAQEPATNLSADAQVTLINSMRSYAETYEAGLPNFLCTQVTTHYTSGRKREKWRKGDTVTAQLTYSNGKEHSNIQYINNKPAPPHVKPFRWALSTSGEFGAVLVRIFDADSEATFEWKGWQELEGKQLASFAFSVAKENSTLELSSFGVSAIVGYQGAVWAEPTTGHVLKIVEEALDIPEELLMNEIKRVVEYGDVQIGGSTYVLPVRAEIVDSTRDDRQRNLIEFNNYRKFAAESTLTFGDAK